ncbi:MAG: hypothetical protein LEGION0398_MBIBDBAK_00053 [Legionellaceae bacterium]
MNLSYNPFCRLTTNNKYRKTNKLFSSHFSSFFQRLKETYMIFNGSSSTEDLSVGIMDYIIPISLFFLVMQFYVMKAPKLIRFLLTPIILILHLPFALLKTIISSVLTALVSPIVLIIHLALKGKTTELKNQSEKVLVARAVGNKFESSHTEQEDPVILANDYNKEEKSLSALGNNNPLKSKFDLLYLLIKMKISVKPFYVDYTNGNVPTLFSPSRFNLSQQMNKKMYLKIFVKHPEQLKTYLKSGLIETMGIIEVSKKNANAIEAMLKTNYFNIVDELSLQEILTLESEISKDEKKEISENKREVVSSLEM